MAGQVRQTLRNVVAVLAEAGAGPEHVGPADLVRHRSRRATSPTRPGSAQAYRDVMGRHFPAMAVVVVSALLEPSAKVEIEATAVVPG